MPRTTLADAALQLLAEHRALAADELGRALAADGRTRAQRPARAVSRALGDDPRFRRLADDRWVVPSQLLDGATFTHRLRREEAQHGVLALDADLAPLELLAPVGLRLPDGRPLAFVFDAEARDAVPLDCDAALVGPPGWLAQRTGTLLQVSVAGSTLEISAAPPPAAASRMVARRLTEAAKAWLEAPALPFVPPTVLLETLVLDALADDPPLLRQPVAPFSEVFGAAGLEVHRAQVGLPGTDWSLVDEFWSFDDEEDDEEEDWADDDDDDPDDDPDDERTAEDDALDDAVARALGLDPMELDALRILMGAFELHRRLGGIAERDVLARLAEILALPSIAHLVATRAWTEPALEPFVAAIGRTARGRQIAGANLVLAACAEARDDVAAAERLLRSAAAAEPGYGPVCVELAHYDLDRGDYRGALANLRAAGVPPDDPQRAWLETVLRPAFPAVGRNEPCPCGSGRKYKACHLGRPADSGVDPASALLHKVSWWLAQPDNQHRAAELVRLAQDEHAGDPPEDLVDQPLVNDILLFDQGQLARFLDVRGPLLPERERALGRVWLVSRRSLYEVQAVRPAAGVTLRDLLGEEIVELTDRTISSRVEPLDLLCLRLLPDGAGSVTTAGGFLVPRLQRRRVVDLLRAADGVALLRWFAAPALPIEVRNTEGEPLRFVTATYQVPDAVATATALARTLDDEGDGRFVETVTRQGQQWLRGTIQLSGDHATIEANSVKRAERLARTLQKAAPGARLVRREERSVDDALASSAAGGGSATEPIDLDAHPEVAAALDTFMRDHEARWVDQPIPALGGLTPRQAAADEAARPELEALLDDLAWEERHARDRGRAGDRGGMNAARLRGLLGIAPRDD